MSSGRGHLLGCSRYAGLRGKALRLDRSALCRQSALRRNKEKEMYTINFIYNA